MDDLTGRCFGQYEIIASIGSGGMGAVYRARDTQLNREVALKVLPPELARDHEFVERFLREANTAAGLEHPHIVAIYNIGEQDGMHYLAMRLLHGQTLNHLIQNTGALPIPRALNIIKQLAGALDYAHQRGIIHRDIKPANIMVDEDDYVTLMDFGIARALVGSKITRTGTMIGTPEYMAPEQFTGEPLNVQSDVYALSVVLYEMLTGRVPFTGETPVAISHGHVYQPPPPPSHYNPHVSQPVEQVILKGLAKRPESRYESTGELTNALEAAVRGNVQPTQQQTLKLVLDGGAEYALHKGVLRLGRSSTNDIILDGDLVSRHHAEIHSDDLNSAIMDLDSANGTFVDEQPLAAHRPHTLHPGMQIRLGNQVLVVQAGPAKVHVVPPISRPRTLVAPQTTQPTYKPQAQKKRPAWIWGALVIIVMCCVALAVTGLLLRAWRKNQLPATPVPDTTSSPTLVVTATTEPEITGDTSPGETPDVTNTLDIPPVSTVTPTPLPTGLVKPTLTLTLKTPIVFPTLYVTRAIATNLVLYTCGDFGKANICSLNTSSGQTRVIIDNPQDNAEPDWSPDGQYVTFQSNRDGNYDIFISNLAGSYILNLTDTPGQDERMPDWSPDGQSIIYEVGDGASNSAIWITNIDGSGKRELLGQASGGRAPVWSPDGTQLALMRQDDDKDYWQIHTVRLSDMREVKLAHNREHCRFPAWSPDGQWLAYNTFVFDGNPTGRTYEIWRVRSDGSGKPQQMTRDDNNGRPSWSPDGTTIIYNHEEYLYTLDTNSGKIAQLKNTQDGWAPDWIW